MYLAYKNHWSSSLSLSLSIYIYIYIYASIQRVYKPQWTPIDNNCWFYVLESHINYFHLQEGFTLFFFFVFFSFFIYFKAWIEKKYMCEFERIHKHINIYMDMFISVWVYIYIYIYIYIYMRVCACVCVCVCLYEHFTSFGPHTLTYIYSLHFCKYIPTSISLYRSCIICVNNEKIARCLSLKENCNGLYIRYFTLMFIYLWNLDDITTKLWKETKRFTVPNNVFPHIHKRLSNRFSLYFYKWSLHSIT